MQDLLAIDREESREDTFGKTGSLSVSSVTTKGGRLAYKNQYLYISLLYHTVLIS